MNRLKDRIVRQIELGGPIGVDHYMATCLYDAEAGYYTTREPFGAAGDFTTAPEISQMFGELVAVWLVQAWHALGRPSPVTLAEIGPGRGTLMADMLRTLRRVAPAMLEAAEIAMVETSPRLAAVQRQTLATQEREIRWCESVESLPEGPLIVIGNEIFDAVPIRQYVKTETGWRQRVIAAEDGDLAFAAGAGSLDESLLPPDAGGAPLASIAEVAPARAALMARIAGRIARHGGAGLFFDYGYLQPALGDTFQALRRHQPVDVLADPGEADLTAHVDFWALAAVARTAGLAARMATQGEFLLGMGLVERAGRLGAEKDEAERERIASQVERLAGPDQMGTLFKALAIMPRGLAIQPFGAAD